MMENLNKKYLRKLEMKLKLFKILKIFGLLSQEKIDSTTREIEEIKFKIENENDLFDDLN